VNRLGVVTALPAEYRTLSAACRNSDRTIAVCAGVGGERAVAAGVGLIGDGVVALLSWGCAGALAPGLAPGSLVVPEWVVGADNRRIAVDRVCHERLCRKLRGSFSVHTGEIAESAGVLFEPSAKRTLALSSGAIAVDMESAALGRLACAHGIAFAVVRAVADSAEHALPEVLATALDDRGRVRWLPLMRAVQLRPRRWGQLWSASRAYRKACASLSRAAATGVLGTLSEGDGNVRQGYAAV